MTKQRQEATTAREGLCRLSWGRHTRLVTPRRREDRKGQRVNRVQSGLIPESVRDPSWVGGNTHRGFRRQVGVAGETEGLTDSACARGRGACPLRPGFTTVHTHLVLTSTQQTWGWVSSQGNTLRAGGRTPEPTQEGAPAGAKGSGQVLAPHRAQSPGRRVLHLWQVRLSTHRRRTFGPRVGTCYGPWFSRGPGAKHPAPSGQHGEPQCASVTLGGICLDKCCLLR